MRVNKQNSAMHMQCDARRLGKGLHTHADGVKERHSALDLIVEMNGEWEERERVGSLL